MSNPAVLVELQTVDPATAANWLERHLFDRQRPVRWTHVSELATAISTGRFVPGTQIVFAVLDGRDYLIDGQHRLWAIVEADRPVTLTVQRIRVEFPDDMAQLYGRYDRHLPRSTMDAIRAECLDEKLGISKTHLERLYAAVAMIGYGFQDGGNRYKAAPHLRSFDERRDLALEYVVEARRYFSMMEGMPSENRKLFTRMSVVAVAMITLRH